MPRRLVTGATITAIGLGLLVSPVVGRAVTGDGLVPIAEVPRDNPALGLVYLGLAPAGRGEPCVGGYELTDPALCSHGPDPAPPGLDVKRDVAPTGRTLPSPTIPRRDTEPAPAQRDVLADAGATAPAEASPALAPADWPAGSAADDLVVGPSGVACAGDGRSGPRVQVMYVYEAGNASRYNRYLGSFRAWAAGVDAIVDASAKETGGSRRVRYVTTAECDVDVREVQVHQNALANVDATIAALGALGFARADRKYMIFADANVYCGIGTYARDDSPGPRNRNNRGPSYGRTDAGCWGAGTAAHELTHNLGGVQHTAPNTSRAGHCVDDHDLMCYADAEDTSVDVECDGDAGERRLDCNHDDYFHTDPPDGSYLARHWNVADSAYLVDAADAPTGGGDGAAATVPPADEPAKAPPADDTVRTAEQPAVDQPADQPAGRPADQPAASAAPPAAGTAPGEPAGPPPGEPAPGPPAAPGPGSTPPPGEPGPGPGATPLPGGQEPPRGAAAPAPGKLSAAATVANATRLSWPAAGRAAGRTRYAVAVDGRVLGTTTATRARVVGLRPNTSYTMQVSVRGADGDLRVHTRAATVRTATAARPPAGRWLHLGNALTGAVAQLAGSRGADGTPLVLGTQDGAADQQWQLRAAGGGRFLVRSRATGKCVAPSGPAQPGAVLTQRACAAEDAAQRWRVVRSTHGYALAASSSLVIGVSRLRFGGQRMLVLQRPTPARYQSWVALPR